MLSQAMAVAGSMSAFGQQGSQVIQRSRAGDGGVAGSGGVYEFEWPKEEEEEEKGERREFSIFEYIFH